MSIKQGSPRRYEAARFGRLLLAATASLIVTMPAVPAWAFLARPAIFAAITNVTKAPDGWLRFCGELPDECKIPDGQQRDVQLTPEKLQELFSINRHVNDRVRWTSDASLYGTPERWAYPLDGGDCEDMVLLKRRLLARAGWPVGSLLISVVEDPRDQKGRHAVLLVRTDRGEFVLDNQTPEILFWYETSYRFISRQSADNPNIWVSFSDKQPRPATHADPH
jgi:predicted transglutaminase-like cysteine proteinase